MGKRPEIQHPSSYVRLMDLGPGMTREEVAQAARHARQQKVTRADGRLAPVAMEPPFEIYRIFPGNGALDILALLFKFCPETRAELEVLGAHLWKTGQVAEMLPAHDGVPHGPGGYRDAIEEAEVFAHYMQGLHFLWHRAFGGQYAPAEASARGLSMPHFLTLLSYGCADVLLEPRQRYHGERGWVAIAVVHDLEAHWECAVRDHDAMFRRAIPADDMHTARTEYGAICYELLDASGEVALWESMGDAFADLQPHLGSDRDGYRERLHDIRVHVMAQPAVYVEMVDPEDRYHLCASRWLRPTQECLARPLRHRLFLTQGDSHLGEEVGFYVATDEAADTSDNFLLVCRLEANMPGGLDCYGSLPRGITHYKAPLNGRIREGRKGGRTQADSIARAQGREYSEIK